MFCPKINHVHLTLKALRCCTNQHTLYAGACGIRYIREMDALPCKPCCCCDVVHLGGAWELATWLHPVSLDATLSDWLRHEARSACFFTDGASHACQTGLTLSLFFAGYIGLVLVSSALPGKPAFAVEWSTLVETWNCSINFFYVNQIFNWLGINFIVQHPVSEPSHGPQTRFDYTAFLAAVTRSDQRMRCLSCWRHWAKLQASFCSRQWRLLAGLYLVVLSPACASSIG